MRSPERQQFFPAKLPFLRTLTGFRPPFRRDRTGFPARARFHPGGSRRLGRQGN
jgi:hypothetical protein